LSTPSKTKLCHFEAKREIFLAADRALFLAAERFLPLVEMTTMRAKRINKF